MAHIDRFYLPHTSHMKQDVVFESKHVLNCFSLYWSLFLTFSLPHFLLIIDLKELYVKSLQGSVYSLNEEVG